MQTGGGGVCRVRVCTACALRAGAALEICCQKESKNGPTIDGKSKIWPPFLRSTAAFPTATALPMTLRLIIRMPLPTNESTHNSAGACSAYGGISPPCIHDRRSYEHCAVQMLHHWMCWSPAFLEPLLYPQSNANAQSN